MRCWPPSADARARANAVAPREEPSLGPFLPRKGVGLALSASDIQTYRSCPLRYKFARVLRIPSAQTVEPALRDRRAPGARALPLRGRHDAPAACSSCSKHGLAPRRPSARSASERAAREGARGAHALPRPSRASSGAKPMWFERALLVPARAPPPARARGPRRPAAATGRRRAVRADRLQDLAPEDAPRSSPTTCSSRCTRSRRAKTGSCECSRQAYYYVLDDVKVPVPRSERRRRGGEGHRCSRSARGSSPRRSSPTPSPSGVRDVRLPRSCARPPRR